MPTLVTANVLYNVTSGTPLMGLGVTATINCERLAAFSPRLIWIQAQFAPGDGVEVIYTTTSTQPDTLVNVWRGWLIVQDSETIIIDATTGGLEDTCDACCDGTNDVPPLYSSNYPVLTAPTTSPFCIARTDAGDSSAFETLNLAYITQILGGATVFGRTGLITKYNVISFTTPVAIGTDTVTAGVCS